HQDDAYKTIGLRADFDALEISEKTDLEFKSKHDGLMHACGHDVHTAYMMVLADVLIEFRHELKVNILVIHQHAEEIPPGGAIDFIEQGIVDDVDVFVGGHVVPFYDVGNFGFKPGVMFAGSDTLEIAFIGKNSHASMPHLGKDAILAASDFVVRLHSILGKNISAFESGILNVGSFNAPGPTNVVNDRAELSISIRYLDLNTRKVMRESIERLVESIKLYYQVEVEFDYREGYPPLVNDENLSMDIYEYFNERGFDYVKSIEIMQEPVMGSEDFARFSLEKPSFFAHFSASNGVNEINHSPYFEVDEKGMLSMAKFVADIVLYLGENF
ncbi:MAG: amidohydrolase, partial [Bacteroidales bacterium]|nr:amidohydrolase [Bacteroidales bacterium]